MLAAFFHADSSEIECVLLGGFDDWHSDLADDDRSPDDYRSEPTPEET